MVRSRKKYIANTVLLWLISFLLWPAGLWAQHLIAKSSVTQVAPGEPFTVEYIVKDAIPDPGSFHMELSKDLQVMSGPRVEQRLEMGRSVQMEVVFSLDLIITRAGAFTIPPASIKVRGRNIRSNSLKMQVTNAPSASGQDVFVLATVNKKEPYIKEAVVVTYKLYVGENISVLQYLPRKMPSYPGFWVENVQLMNSDFVQETYKGRHYAAAVIKKDILFPLKAGALTVDSLGLDFVGQKMESTPGNLLSPSFPFGMGPMGRPIQTYVRSNDIKLNIKPLPVQGQPADFSGLVGVGVLSAKVDQKAVKANEPLVYTLTVGGEGSLTLLDPFKLKLPADVEVFPPKSQVNVDRSGATLNGTRSFEYTLIPHKTGTLTLPAIPFSYFDPVDKKYVSSHTQEFSIEVEKAAAKDDQNSKDTSSHSGSGRIFRFPRLHVSNTTLLALGGGLLIVIGLLMALRRRDHHDGDDDNEGEAEKPAPYVPEPPRPVHTTETASREKEYQPPYAPVAPPVQEPVRQPAPEMSPMQYKEEELSAGQVLRERMHAAGRFLENMQVPEFLNELQEALYAYVQYKTHLPMAQATAGNIRQALLDKQESPEKAERFIRLLQQCEFARYAPFPGMVDIKAMHQEAIQLMTM